jgi:uncharacterized membrane protein YvbJ
MTLGYCPSCGAARTGQPFCAQCGQRFDAVAPSASSPSPTKQLARSATTVQNVQLMLLGGMLLGFIVGVLIAAYLILPMGGVAIFVAVFFPFVAAFIGQRVVLSMLAR